MPATGQPLRKRPIYRGEWHRICAEKCHSRVGEEDMSGNSERKRGRERYERLNGGWDDRDAIGELDGVERY